MVVAIAEKTLLGSFGEPGIGTFGIKRFENALVDLFVLQDIAFLIGKDADRDAPGALTRKHPVRALLDHRAQAVLAAGGDKTGVVDR
ncbi:hypothetical protein D3C71_1999630 [compost metagenome]